MLHNHLRNFTSHELAIDLDTADKTDDSTDGIDQFCGGIEIRGHHGCRLVDTRQTVSGGIEVGGTQHKCEHCSHRAAHVWGVHKRHDTVIEFFEGFCHKFFF